MTEEYYTIRSKEELEYCPICGSETDREQFDVGLYKTNVRILCPEHGELTISA